MFFTTYHQIAELEREHRASTFSESDLVRRARIPVAVIDDEPFVPQQTLKNNGYDIHVLGDIKTLSEVSAYNIILCDLQGVGLHFNEKNQGAYIIDEIKRNHPEKFVLAYTGGAVNSEVTIRANQSADFFLRKDADIEDWRDKLDSIIGFLSNPVLVWKRQRLALVESDVATLDILKMEDAYVRSIQERSGLRFRAAISKPELSKDARSIGQSLVASGIFEIFFG